VLSRDEDGDELLLGVPKVFAPICLLLARLAGSYVPFSLAKSLTPWVSMILEDSASLAEELEEVEGFENIHIPSLNGSQCTSFPSCLHPASNLWRCFLAVAGESVCASKYS
jgi:hypothetical protein